MPKKKPNLAEIKNPALSSEEIEKKVWDKLKLCHDPEIPISVVDLGLIYHVGVEPFKKEKKEGHQANIRMTLTTPGCSMGEYIMEEIRHRVGALPEIKHVNIELVFDPPWDRSMISEEAKLTLGIL